MVEKKKRTKKEIAPKKEKRPTQKKAGKKEDVKQPLERKPVTEEMIQSESILWHPLVSEKAVGMIESQNKLQFIVKPSSNKKEIRRAVEALYAVKVSKVRTLRDWRGRKKAIVQLSKPFKAQELASKIGVL